jgi:RP/EB family microtubule-associated protein
MAAAAVANIGLMDSAYFVGRGEILTWINATLQLSLAKVEEVSLRLTPPALQSPSRVSQHY